MGEEEPLGCCQIHQEQHPEAVQVDQTEDNGKPAPVDPGDKQGQI